MKGAMRGQRGFTLLELLVAFAIMGVSLGMIYRAAGGSARSVGDVERYQRAVLLAESLLALRDAVPEQGWSDAGQSAGYNWRLASTPYPTAVTDPRAPAMHEISVAVTWSDGVRARQFELSTLKPQRRPIPGGALR